ncbi:MAG: outer membrane beta-barrel protein [Flavobacteriales bacterium]|nr:outer membrane beta-barrel protein [Flavobacteriales bacterium]
MIKKIFSFAVACTMGIAGWTQVEEQKSDTTEISLGDLKVMVYEDPEAEPDSVKEEKNRIFHSGGRFDLGMNILFDANGSTDMTGDNQWLDLDYAKSLSWSYYPFDARLDIVDEYVQLGFGAGFEWRNYGLANNVNVYPKMPIYDSTLTEVVEYRDTTFGVISDQFDFSKNRLRTTYLKVPLVLEFNTSTKDSKSFHVEAGVIGGWRLGSNIKQKFTEDGVDQKRKVKDDFNFNDFTLDATVRVGYGDVTVFANYGLTPLFADGRGPEIYPLTVGISILTW